MKKILVLVLILAAAIGAALYFMRQPSQPASAEYYADYLPAETLATVSLLDLKGLADDFPASDLGRLLAKSTIHAILTELGTRPEAAAEYDQLYDGLAGVMTNPAFREIFGDDAAVAVLPPDVARLQKNPEEELRKSLLVFGTSSVSGAVDSFARLVMSQSVTRETVDNIELTRIQLDENEVMYGSTHGGILILAYDPARVTAAVRQKAQGSGLRQTTGFRDAGSLWAQAAGSREYGRSYVNFAGIRQLLAASPDADSRKLSDYLQGFTAMGSVFFERGDELHVVNRMSYDFEALNPLVKKQYQAVSGENLALGLLTPETLTYYWVSLIDNDYLKSLLTAAGAQQYQKADARFRRELGISLDAAIAAVGPQTGMAVNDIVNTGMFPLPKVVLFLQVKDHAVALKMVERLRQDIARRGFAAEQSQEVDGKKVYSWPILPGEATQPSLVLTDKMIYVANGPQALVDLVQKGSKLNVLPVPMTQVLGEGMVQQIRKSNYTTFVMRPDRMATKMKDAADWMAGIMAASNGRHADRLKEEILKLMHAVDILTATSEVEKEYAVSSLVLKYKPAATAAAK